MAHTTYHNYRSNPPAATTGEYRLNPANLPFEKRGHTAMRGLLLALAVMLSGWVLPAQAATLSFTGAFVNDDDLWIKHFTLSAATEITAQTWSFGGGFNANGIHIQSGGFDPTLAIFEDGGSQLLLGISRGGTDPAGPGANPSHGYTWDAYFSMQLNAGSYSLVLSQDSNIPNGPSWLDGYLYDSNLGTGDHHFTNQNTSPYNPYATFVLADGSQRNALWAVDISPFTVPEPSTLALLIAGLACFLAARVLRSHRQSVESTMLPARACSNHA